MPATINSAFKNCLAQLILTIKEGMLWHRASLGKPWSILRLDFWLEGFLVAVLKKHNMQIILKILCMDWCVVLS